MIKTSAKLGAEENFLNLIKNIYKKLRADTILNVKLPDTFFLKSGTRDFLGSPVVKIPCFNCRGHGFNPSLGN